MLQSIRDESFEAAIEVKSGRQLADSFFCNKIGHKDSALQVSEAQTHTPRTKATLKTASKSLSMQSLQLIMCETETEHV